MATGASLPEGKEDQLNRSLAECGVNDINDYSYQEKMDLLRMLQQSANTAAKEEEERFSQMEPELTDDESSNQCFERQQQVKLAHQGVSLTRKEKDEDCVVIKEVSSMPRPIAKVIPNVTSSRIPQLLIRNINQSGRQSPLTTSNEQPSSSPGRLGNPCARRGIHDSPFKTLFSASEIVFDHVSHVPGLDALNCATVIPVVFECEKRRKIRHEVPFYVRPAGMNLNEYLVLFNKNVDALKRRYIEKQRKCLNFKPWGPPIKVSNNSMSTFQIELTDQDDGDLATSDTGTVSESAPYLLQENHYNLRERTTKKNDILYTADDDEDEDNIIISRKKMSRYSALDDSISLKSVFNNPVVGSTRGRDMIKNADAQRAKQNSSNSQNTLDIIDSNSSDSDFLPAGKDISEPKRALPPSNATVTKRTYKKRENSNTNKKNASRVSDKAGSWHNPKLELSEDTEDGAILSPISTKRRRIMATNTQTFSRNIGNMNPEQLKEVLENGDFSEPDAMGQPSDIVECPMCKKSFPRTAIERHADSCCDSPMPDSVDENIHIPPSEEEENGMRL